MNVNLTPALEQLVLGKVITGRYNSASEVVREALRLLEERDQIRKLRLKEIRRKIDEGWGSLLSGEGVDGDEFFHQLEREERALARKQAK